MFSGVLPKREIVMKRTDEQLAEISSKKLAEMSFKKFKDTLPELIQHTPNARLFIKKVDQYILDVNREKRKVIDRVKTCIEVVYHTIDVLNKYVENIVRYRHEGCVAVAKSLIQIRETFIEYFGSQVYSILYEPEYKPHLNQRKNDELFLCLKYFIICKDNLKGILDYMFATSSSKDPVVVKEQKRIMEEKRKAFVQSPYFLELGARFMHPSNLENGWWESRGLIDDEGFLEVP